jgi:hypothetical protein
LRCGHARSLARPQNEVAQRRKRIRRVRPLGA